MNKLNGFNNGRDTTDGVGGQPGPFELTDEERLALKEAGINAHKWWSVQYSDTKEPIAIFREEHWAKQWAWNNCRTAEIVPYEIVIK